METSAWIEYLLLGCTGLIVGWLLRLESKGNENSKEASDVRDRVIELEKELVKNYHSKADLRQIVQDALRPIESGLDRLSRAVERMTDRKNNHNDNEDI